MKNISFIAVLFSIAVLSACHQNSQDTHGTSDSAEISTRESDTALINNKPPDTIMPPASNVTPDSTAGSSTR